MRKSRNISSEVKIGHANDDHHNRNQMARVKENSNDECYTPIDEIERELSYWASLGKFEGKRILCPCDLKISAEVAAVQIDFSPPDTVTIIYNNVERENFGLFDLIDKKYEIKKSIIDRNKVESILGDSPVSNFVRVFIRHAREWKISAITASGYNPKTNEGIRFQDINFNAYDMIVTNPPFSCYSEFMDKVVDKVDFISIAPFLNRVAANIGLPMMLRKVYIGKSGDEYGGYSSIDFITDTGKKVNVGCDWITSFNEAQEERNIRLHNSSNGIKFDPHANYLVMGNMTMKDGTHPIRVPSKDFPEDYDGWMYASVNILSYISHDDYDWYGTNYMKYFNTTNPQANPFNHKIVLGMTKVNGQGGFNGIVFRKKQII